MIFNYSLILVITSVLASMTWGAPGYKNFTVEISKVPHWQSKILLNSRPVTKRLEEKQIKMHYEKQTPNRSAVFVYTWQDWLKRFSYCFRDLFCLPVFVLLTLVIIIQQAGGPRTRLKTVGDHTFGAAAARIWNDLPPSITNASSISAFRKHLKTYLFNQQTHYCTVYSVLVTVLMAH